MKPNVFIVCTGVGHINRGYESFTIECFNELKASKNFELYLLKGGGKSFQKEQKIPCIKRNTRLASILGKISGKEIYWIEQFTFLIGMLPALFKYKPAVIYYSDFILGTFLWHLRKMLNLKFKLLFSNGAPNGPPFNTEDHIQQLLPMYMRQAHEAGVPLSKQTLLPYAITVNLKTINENINNRRALLQTLSLPADKKIIICVGAVNSHHKRIDYLIDEFAMMDNKDYFLVVLGQIDELSKPILQQAKDKLLNNNYLIIQVMSNAVIQYLCVADYFILPSLNEGLPRVIPEAMSAGLLPILHDYTVTRETAMDYAVFRNMKETGILQSAIDEVNKKNIAREELTSYAIKNYSWQNLSVKYEQMIIKNFP